MQTRASPTTLQRKFEPSIFWFAAEKLKCWRKNVEILNLELVSIEVKCQNFKSSVTCQIPHRTPTFIANFPSNELCAHETDLHQEFLLMWLFPDNVQISFVIDFCWQRTLTTTRNRHQLDNDWLIMVGIRQEKNVHKSTKSFSTVRIRCFMSRSKGTEESFLDIFIQGMLTLTCQACSEKTLPALKGLTVCHNF